MSEALDVARRGAKGADKKRRAKVSALKKAKPRAQSVASGEVVRGWGWRGVFAGSVVLIVCVALGVQVASQSQRMRALYSQLQQGQEAKDGLLAERSRLLLERGALNSYSAAETMAREKLDMRFPETISRVVVESAGAPRQRLIGLRGRE